MESMGFAAAGLTAGANSLFGYNRKNFLYDRKMRQKHEFKVAAFRNQQAELWREDVRDLIELTTSKMETYSIVNGILLTLCVESLTAGRLMPGTPQWVLWLYVLSLGGAFVYFMLALWFAMHASVAAQSGATRLLTQLVRLPVPSWDQLEAMRTYGSACEGLAASKLFRLPFVDHLVGCFRTQERTHEMKDQRKTLVDPWGLERTGSGIYELQHRPTKESRHAKLVQVASANWQCHEGFARVSMTMGVSQFLYSIMYYCIGYVLVEGGEAVGAFLFCTLIVGGIMMLLDLDLSLVAREASVARALVIAPPLMSSVAAFLWRTCTSGNKLLALVVVPMIFGLHAFELSHLLLIANVQEQPNGSMLPLRWRTVLYVDVFGWLANISGQSNACKKPRWPFRRYNRNGYSPVVQRGKGEYVPDHEPDVCIEQDTSDEDVFLEGCPERIEEARQGAQARMDVNDDVQNSLEQELRMELAFWQSAEVLRALTVEDRERVYRCNRKFERLASFGEGLDGSMTSKKGRINQRDTPAHVQRHKRSLDRLTNTKACGDFAAETGPSRSLYSIEACLEAARTGTVGPRHGRNGPSLAPDAEANATLQEPLKGVGSPGVIPPVHMAAFDAESFFPPSTIASKGMHEEVVPSGTAPWHVFRNMTLVLVGLYCAGALWCISKLSGLPDLHLKPLSAVEAEFSQHSLEGSSMIVEEVAKDSRARSSEYVETQARRSLLKLPQGRPIKTIWPHSNRFEPRALSCDSLGQRFVVADDFGVYSAWLIIASEEDDSIRSQRGPQHLRSQGPQKRPERLEARFERAPPCRQLEGQTPMDVEIVCARDPRSPDKEVCSALVLYSHGRVMLTECPLQENADGIASTWDILTDWLDDFNNEAIESVALSSKCRGPTNASEELGLDLKGCMFVGTTGCRLVQLRRHVTQQNQLVPLWATQPRRRLKWDPAIETAMSHGSIHILPAGYVMVLQPWGSVSTTDTTRPGTMWALDPGEDQVIGEWELPKDVQWLSLCGGGNDALFMLGRGGVDSASALWRFPLPPELQRPAGPDTGAAGY